VSIDDFDPLEQHKKPNSPRTVEACRLEGIKPKELLYKPLDWYKQRYPAELAQVRYDMLDNKRKELIEQVKEKRQELIYKQERKSRMSYSPDATNGAWGNINGGSQSVKNLQLATPANKSMNKTASTQFFSTSGLKEYNTDAVERTRMRELKMLQGLLKNEEFKNQKLQEQQHNFEEALSKAEKQKRKDMLKARADNERRRQEELERKRREDEEERKARKRAIKALREKEKQDEEERKRQERKRQEYNRFLQEKEKERQLKQEKSKKLFEDF